MYLDDKTRNRALEHFKRMMTERAPALVEHSAVLWDERAGKWIAGLEADTSDANPMRARARATAAFLRKRGLLGADDCVIDVGCGPGLFVTEFAASAREVVGLDYSGRFLDYTLENAKRLGLNNVRVLREDFGALDVDSAGLAGAFDLVFNCTTPAVCTNGARAKLMRMSRAYCCDISFVTIVDTLAERVSREVFGRPFQPRWTGQDFYALFNTLLLQGYYPETAYYTDKRDEVVAIDDDGVQVCVRVLGLEAPEDVERVRNYLHALGSVERHSEFHYGLILWDVRV
jgi:SAM-dependent methyltransferase